MTPIVSRGSSPTSIFGSLHAGDTIGLKPGSPFPLNVHFSFHFSFHFTFHFLKSAPRVHVGWKLGPTTDTTFLR